MCSALWLSPSYSEEDPLCWESRGVGRGDKEQDLSMLCVTDTWGIELVCFLFIFILLCGFHFKNLCYIRMKPLDLGHIREYLIKRAIQRWLVCCKAWQAIAECYLRVVNVVKGGWYCWTGVLAALGVTHLWHGLKTIACPISILLDLSGADFLCSTSIHYPIFLVPFIMCYIRCSFTIKGRLSSDLLDWYLEGLEKFHEVPERLCHFMPVREWSQRILLFQ